jgi:hypothetical protein
MSIVADGFGITAAGFMPVSNRSMAATSNVLSARGSGIYASVRADQIRAAFAKQVRPADFVQVVRGPEPQ